MHFKLEEPGSLKKEKERMVTLPLPLQPIFAAKRHGILSQASPVFLSGDLQ